MKKEKASFIRIGEELNEKELSVLPIGSRVFQFDVNDEDTFASVFDEINSADEVELDNWVARNKALLGEPTLETSVFTSTEPKTLKFIFIITEEA